MTNIPMQAGLGTGSILKTQGNTLLQGAQQTPQQGLLGFLNLILQNMQGQAGVQGAPANIGDLATKIAEFLKANPNDQAGLQKLIESFAPQMTPEMSAKLAEVLQKIGQPAQQGQPAKATLVSDLTASMVQDIQQQPSLEQQTADILTEKPTMDQMAALLAQMQPGADANDSSQLMQMLKEITPDQNILTALQAKFADLKLTNGEINKDVLVKFKADITAFLQEQGFDPATIQKYLSAFAKTLRGQSPEQASLTKALEQNAPAPSFQMRETAASEEQKTAPPPQAGPKTNTTAQNNPPPLPPQTQQNQQAPKPAPAATSNLAMINAMVSGDNEAGMEGGFGRQNSFTPSNNFTDASGLMKHTGEANPQGFINYMSAARGQQSAMTQMVTLQIQRNAAAKIDTFTLQLDPADLGKLDIRLKFDRDGGVKAHLTADRPETLAMLQRDASQIEKLLLQSGLDVEGGALSFDLREQGNQTHERDADGSVADDDFAAHLGGAADNETIAARIAVEAQGYITQNGVNIMV